MALTDTKLRNLKSGDKAYQEADEGGLFVEVMPGGAKVWRMRYRLAIKQEKITLGDYPTYSLAEARTWRDDCKALAGRGLSPMAKALPSSVSASFLSVSSPVIFP